MPRTTQLRRVVKKVAPCIVRRWRRERHGKSPRNRHREEIEVVSHHQVESKERNCVPQVVANQLLVVRRTCVCLRGPLNNGWKVRVRSCNHTSRLFVPLCFLSYIFGLWLSTVILQDRGGKRWMYLRDYGIINTAFLESPVIIGKIKEKVKQTGQPFTMLSAHASECNATYSL